MAQRVLTDEERQALRGDTNFLINCEWAVRNYADYWSTNDGSGFTTPFAALTKYVKDRLIGVDIVLHDIADSDLALKILKVTKGMTVDLAAAPLSAATINAAMLAQGKFDEVASLYFNYRGESIDWAVGGN